MRTPKLSILWNVQKGRCYYCKRQMYGKNNPMAKLFPDLMVTEDHKIPKCKGGKRGDNIVLACRKCNREKDIMTDDEYLQILKEDQC